MVSLYSYADFIYPFNECSFVCADKNMVKFRPEVHCPHIGPSGGDMCSKCTFYLDGISYTPSAFLSCTRLHQRCWRLSVLINTCGAKRKLLCQWHEWVVSQHRGPAVWSKLGGYCTNYCCICGSLSNWLSGITSLTFWLVLGSNDDVVCFFIPHFKSRGVHTFSGISWIFQAFTWAQTKYCRMWGFNIQVSVFGVPRLLITQYSRFDQRNLHDHWPYGPKFYIERSIFHMIGPTTTALFDRVRRCMVPQSNVTVSRTLLSHWRIFLNFLHLAPVLFQFYHWSSQC